jgi:hypothetical protein
MDDKLRDLADRWRRDYERYDVDRLIWTFNTCLDDPSRIAALEVLMDRLCGDISEVDRAKIGRFLSRRDVREFAERHNLGRDG